MGRLTGGALTQRLLQPILHLETLDLRDQMQTRHRPWTRQLPLQIAYKTIPRLLFSARRSWPYRQKKQPLLLLENCASRTSSSIVLGRRLKISRPTSREVGS